MANFFRNFGLGATGIGAVLLAGTAFAGASPQSTTFQVSANVPSTCSIQSAGNLSFGNYDVTSASSTTGSSTISVKCSKGTAITVALNGGGAGSVTARQMTDAGAHTLNYGLFTSSVTNATCTGGTVFGDGTGGSATGSGTSTSVNTPISLTVFGCIPAGQDVNAGATETYSDTITVTVSFT